MKQYSDYDTSELAALDDAAIQRLIDIEVAVEGIVPVPEPEGLTVKKADLQKKVTAYVVGGLIFKNHEDAEKVALMELLDGKYDYSGAGYDYRWLEPLDSRVETNQYYEQAEVRAAGMAISEFNNRKDQYDRDRAVYEKYLKLIRGCSSAVWEAVGIARKEMCRIDAANHTLHKYLDLADGDETVAQNFFRNTYKDQPDMIKAVLGEKVDQNLTEMVQSPETQPGVEAQAAG